jgi:hypothetical protein
VKYRGLGWTGAAVLCFGAVARAAAPVWWAEATNLVVRVHEHTFHRASANGIGCRVRVRLYFDAPADRYRDPAAERNHYRFLAEVKLSGGDHFVSEVFDNAEVGARVFAFSHDTGSEGCWAEKEHALRKVDVHACRGEHCTPEAFE